MYLGISSYNHESALALINDKGELIDFEREECLTRIKGDKSFPKFSIEQVLERNNVNLKQIHSVCFYERPLSAYLYPLKTACYHLPKSIRLLTHQFRNFNKSSLACYLDLAKKFPTLESKLIYSDHHLSHTLSALAYSSRIEDLCSIVVDGFGDRSTASISFVKDPLNIKEIWNCQYPTSLGLFYSAITDFLGFTVNEGEYKVMGLSAFGNSESELSKKINELIYWDEESENIKMNLEYFSYYSSTSESYSDKLVELLGKPRHPFKKLIPNEEDFQKYADIARGAQDITINIIKNIFKYAYKKTGSNHFYFQVE